MCVANCPAGYYKNISINQCSLCDPSCSTCSGPASTECLSCSLPRYFKDSAKECVTLCDPDQFGSPTPTPACLSCNPSCHTCSSASASSCVTCTGSLYLDGSSSSCVSNCPSGTFKEISTNKCAACNTSCTTCTGSSNSECLSCTLPNFFQSSTSTCVGTCNSNQFSLSSLTP